MSKNSIQHHIGKMAELSKITTPLPQGGQTQLKNQ